MKMPNLEIMEIWNGQAGLAMLFRYQFAGEGQRAVITLKGTWEFDLRSPVIQAWEAVALNHCSDGFVVVRELLDAAIIRCHGDTIQHLKLVMSVIRPVSLRQIQLEHIIRDGAQD